MADSRALGRREIRAGDAAAEGLLHGLVAGIGMACVLVLAGLPAGQGPGQVLSHFDPAGVLPVTGMFLHLAMSGIYGLLFGLALRPFVARGAVSAPLALVAGLVYGGLLLAVARGLMASSAAVHLRQMPALGWVLGHFVYGLILGILASRGRGD